ncbi:hypothetical protein [uncultured Algoriphagus sp.]|uniref:hypothetical protein n=1 Tax=uncultured Algoriphagus sp. TaxID=417365 RepID=UPI0030EB99B9|tara:strand:+ start:191 stop:1942 length:1752 start_codon:yes stop_codon:yes gene_type:complete
MDIINFDEFSRIINAGGDISNKKLFEPASFSSRGIGKDLTFKNCVFEKGLRFNTFSVSRKIRFEKCIFKDYVYFIDTTFRRTPEIIDCDFENEVILNNCILPGLHFSGGSIKKLTFSNSLRNVGVHYGEVKFLNSIQIEKLEFRKLITDKAIKLIQVNIETLSIGKSTFEESFCFADVDDKGFYKGREIFITSSKFFGRVDFHKGEIEENIYIQKVEFNEQFVFRKKFRSREISMDQVRSGYSVSIDYRNNLETLNLSNLVFDLGMSVFSGSSLCAHKLDDLATEGKLDINFSGLFYGNFLVENIDINTINMHGSNFGNIVFNNISTNWIWITDFINNQKVHFKGLKLNESFNVLVIHDATMGNIEFENTNFMKFNELVISKSEISNLALTNCIPPRRIQIRTKNPKIGVGAEISLDSKISSNVYFRDSYRQLKQSMEKAGNRYYSLHYKSLEMHYHWKELRFGWDKVLLTFNWLSNNHGVSWVRGIVFTLTCTFITFSLLVAQVETPFFVWNFNATTGEIIKGFKAGLPEFVKYLSSFPSLIISGLNENDYKVSGIVLFSRILIGIGIFQTISAFRKYGGKS